MSDNNEGSRRPLASRDAGWARSVAHWIAGTPLTPNAISMLSMVFAAAAGLALVFLPGSDGSTRILILVVVIAGCQLRLLCNLFDGMVAIEGGKRMADGAFWNEFPDRISDIIIFPCMGLAAGVPWLGWAAAALAVLTSYIRELGSANGLVADFCGPMGKPQRMAAVTVVTLVAIAGEFGGLDQKTVFQFGLWMIVIGTAGTISRRCANMISGLRQAEPD